MPDIPDYTFKQNFPVASIVEAAQRKAQMEEQNRTQGNQQFVQGLQAIGGIGQSLVDKRLKVAQALALGRQYGIPDDQSKLMDPDQILKVAAINKGGVDMQMLMSLIHPGMKDAHAASTASQPGTETPVPSNGAMLTGGLGSTTPVAPAPAPLTEGTTGQAQPAIPAAPAQQTPVPIPAPPSKPKMVNKATFDMAYKIIKDNSIDPVVTQEEALAAHGVRHGTKVVNTSANAGNMSWESASPQLQNLAKGVYEGRIEPGAIGFRDRTKVSLLANEYAALSGLPPFKSYAAGVNATMAKFSTSGKMGQTANSLNTALGHAASAFDTYQAMGNTNQKWLNTPINKLKKETNDPNVVALGINLNALQGELANVFKNSGATDQEISHWRDYLTDSLTPEQYIGALSKVDDLLKSRLSALEYQRSTAGGGTGAPLISPHAQEISEQLSSKSVAPSSGTWNNDQEKKLQMLLEKQKNGTLKS